MQDCPRVAVSGRRRNQRDRLGSGRRRPTGAAAPQRRPAVVIVDLEGWEEAELAASQGT